MHRDTLFIFLAVPVALLGGIASLWLTFQLIEISGAMLLAIAFAGFSVFLVLAALSLAAVGTVELLQSR